MGDALENSSAKCRKYRHVSIADSNDFAEIIFLQRRLT